jgi:hypothetical protein
MAGRKPLTDEQKERNNIKRREQRLKNKLEKANGQLIELEASKPPEPEVIENIEDPDEVQKRKMEIAEKRLKALELARSKKISPSQIRKNNEEEVMRIKAEKEQEMMIKEQEMMKMKEENEKLKVMAEEKQKVKIVKKYVSTPIPIPMKKKKSPRPQEVAVAVPSTEYLVQQTYAEQLQERMRQAMLNKVMASTFGN